MSATKVLDESLNKKLFTGLPSQLKPLSVAVLMALSSASAEAVTFSFRDNTAADVLGSGANYAACNMDYLAGKEFRMCQPDNMSLGGGIPLQKSMIDGVESWDFDAGSGLMTSVTNTATTLGLDTANIPYTMSGYLPASGDPFGGLAMDQGAIFLTAPFAFLAPYTGSGAGTLYGVGQYKATGADSFELFFPVLEAQWSGVHFQLGATAGKGITFFGATDGSDFTMFAEHTITPTEDIFGAGFGNWTSQWRYAGTITGFVPVLANPPTSNVGTFTPTPPSVNGRISQADAEAIGGVDTSMANVCIGGCFDYSVTGLTAGVSVEITLPLTNALPAGTVYRMFDGAVWRNFVTDASNFIEYGSTGTSPVDCSGVTWSATLTPGIDNCARLTKNEGGPNDLDVVATTLTDPGGFALPKATIANNVIPAEELSGCSLSFQPVSATKRADWWIVGLFLAALGIRRTLRKQQVKY